jgi:hypothetical protein
MTQTIQAIFENGVFRPCTPVSVPDGEHVTLTLHSQAPAAQTPSWPQLPPELATDADGLIVAKGTRITLTLILRRHFEGMPWPAIAEEYPTVCSTNWPAIARFVEFNREPLRLVSKEEQRALEELRKASPSRLNLQVLRERFEQKHGKPFPRLDAEISH